MLSALIDFSLENRFLVLALVLLMAVGGVYAAVTIPIDAVPDMTNVQVMVVSKAGSLSPVEVERYITYPVESTMSGLPQVQEIREPIIVANILTPPDYIGNVITLCEEKRGVQRSIQYLATQVQISYEMPLAEVVMDFFDRLKSVSRGYASMDYHFDRFEAGPFVRTDVLINGDRVDALSLIMHRSHADRRGRELVERMKDLIPRQQFDVAIQAAVGAQIIARSTVKALRKNVLAKCYGGDISRKKKLLEKQKEGKKRMKQVGRVEIPQEAFLAVLKVDK